MLYLQIKSRAAIQPGEQLKVHHVADARDTGRKDVSDLPVECPQKAGVWRLPAMAVIKAVEGHCSQITVPGEQECFVHVVPKNQRNKTHPLRFVGGLTEGKR